MIVFNDIRLCSRKSGLESQRSNNIILNAAVVYVSLTAREFLGWFTKSNSLSVPATAYIIIQCRETKKHKKRVEFVLPSSRELYHLLGCRLSPVSRLLLKWRD